MTVVAPIEREAATLFVVHGDAECERCGEQAVLKFSGIVMTEVDTRDEMMRGFTLCWGCAHSFLDLILERGIAR